MAKISKNGFTLRNKKDSNGENQYVLYFNGTMVGAMYDGGTIHILEGHITNKVDLASGLLRVDVQEKYITEEKREPQKINS